jgi:hypothetical protein
MNLQELKQIAKTLKKATKSPAITRICEFVIAQATDERCQECERRRTKDAERLARFRRKGTINGCISS